MQDLLSEIKLLDEFFFVMQDQYPLKYKAWQTLKSAVSVQTANNSQSDAITLWKEYSAAATNGCGAEWLYHNDNRINAVIA